MKVPSNDDDDVANETMEALEIESTIDEEYYDDYDDEDVERDGLISGAKRDLGLTEKNSGKKICFTLTFIALFSIGISVIIHWQDGQEEDLDSIIPNALISGGPLQSVYNRKDFRNAKGNIPVYWEDIMNTTDRESDEEESPILPHLGPCYLPKNEPKWEELIAQNKNIESENDIQYKKDNKRQHNTISNELDGLCRPGFIIIGAGKCGTSSLYQYLVGHERVLPAKEKQIHYFKYFTTRPMNWYLQHFPPTEVFLSNGALMTGEASPGYLPYPEVAFRLGNWMHDRASNGIHHNVGSPKIITIVRNPLERSYSSYKYNYRDPLVKKMLAKENSNGKKLKRTKEWFIENQIFSFEELIAAELKQLKDCLRPGSFGEELTRQKHQESWALPLHEKRKQEGLPGLVAIDETCYGDKVSDKIPRKQWSALVKKNPNKVIDVSNTFLVQSLIGRSLYVLPLDWWYELYPENQLYMVCNEDLKNDASVTMSDVSDFLGLPSFNFDEVTSKGMYNVGGHTGYETVTSWNKTSSESTEIPISPALKKDYLDFVRPFNERLFQLTGKQCNW